MKLLINLNIFSKTFHKISSSVIGRCFSCVHHTLNAIKIAFDECLGSQAVFRVKISAIGLLKMATDGFQD